MPNKPSDPSGNDKKRHIGNDYVAIIYNNSGEDFDISTLKVQFTHLQIPANLQAARNLHQSSQTISFLAGPISIRLRRRSTAGPQNESVDCQIQANFGGTHRASRAEDRVRPKPSDYGETAGASLECKHTCNGKFEAVK